jgi:membrane associated rhomboid family serine protease
VPVVTRTLIIANVVVFFFELSLPREAVEQVFYLFGIVPARFTHPEWAAFVGLPINDYAIVSAADAQAVIRRVSTFSLSLWTPA